MATSEVTTLNQSAASIITKALRKARIIPAMQPIPPQYYELGIEALNLLIARYRNKNWSLWKQKEMVLFLEEGKKKYSLGPTGDRASCFDEFIQASVLTDTPSNETSIELDNITGINGAEDILDFNPTSSVGGWTTNNATISLIDTNTLQIEDTAVGGYADFQQIAVVPGRTYFFQINLLETSNATEISVLAGQSLTVINSAVFSTLTPFEAFIQFTATEDSVVLRIATQGAFSGETVDFDSVRLRDTSTGEQLGFRVDATLREWNVVTRVGPGPNTVQLLNVTQNPSVAGQTVFVFKDLPQRPLKLRNYRSKDALFDDEIPVNTWSRAQYMKQTIKSSKGLPTQAYFNPTLDDSELYVWQTASDVNQLLLFTANEPLQVMTENIDSPDFPDGAVNFLVWALASEIGPEFGVPDNRQATLDAKAAVLEKDFLDTDEEQGSLYATPDSENRI